MNYKISWLKTSNEKFFNKVSKSTVARNKYHFCVHDNDDQRVASELGRSSALDSQGHASTLSNKEKRKKRKQNPNYAFLEDAIHKAEEKFKAKLSIDLDNCAYYPPRPAMRFIPTPQITHKLIFQACLLDVKDFKAPPSFRERWDADYIESSLSPSSRMGTTGI